MHKHDNGRFTKNHSNLSIASQSDYHRINRNLFKVILETVNINHETYRGK